MKAQILYNLNPSHDALSYCQIHLTLTNIDAYPRQMQSKTAVTSGLLQGGQGLRCNGFISKLLLSMSPLNKLILEMRFKP